MRNRQMSGRVAGVMISIAAAIVTSVAAISGEDWTRHGGGEPCLRRPRAQRYAPPENHDHRAAQRDTALASAAHNVGKSEGSVRALAMKITGSVSSAREVPVPRRMQ